MKLRAVPLVAVGIAGLLLASAVGAVVVRNDDDDKVATDATTTSSFPPVEETTTTVVDPGITVITDVPPASVAPVPAPESASTTSSVAPAAAAQPVLAVDPAPCQVPASQPPPAGPAGPSGVFTVAVANPAVRLANASGRLPAWRPKTGQVVSVSVASGKPPGLCLSGPDGAGAKALTTPIGVGRPALSADGGRLALRSSRPGVAELVVFSVEGADQKLILSSTDVGDPVWLGNGTAVVSCALNGGSRRLVSVPAGGGEPKVLRDTCPSSPVSSSPDGSRIAFAQGGQVTVLSTTTRAATNLKVGTSISGAAAPSWSPDGNRVAFAYTDAGGQAIGILDLKAGNGATGLRANGLTSPTWAPTGDLLAFLAADGNGQSLSVVKADGTGVRKLAACQTRCSLGAQPWAPDASSVVLELTGTAF